MMCEKIALESMKNKFGKSRKSSNKDKGFGLNLAFYFGQINRFSGQYSICSYEKVKKRMSRRHFPIKSENIIFTHVYK
jgi:hypothetical protein